VRAARIGEGAEILPNISVEFAIRYSTENGEVKLEKKKDIAKRLGHSPDYSDAAMYGDYVRDPLPMDEEAGRALDENRQDRATPLNLDRANRTMKRLSGQEEIDRELKREARAASRPAFANPWRGK
jgi:hypothetical protein